MNWARRKIEEPKKKPQLLPRLGQCPSLGRSRGFIDFLSKICKILALGNFSPKLPAWTTWRCLALKPPYLPDCIFFTNQIIAKSFFWWSKDHFLCFFILLKFFLVFGFLNLFPVQLQTYLLPYDIRLHYRIMIFLVNRSSIFVFFFCYKKS